MTTTVEVLVTRTIKPLTDPPATGDWVRVTTRDNSGAIIAVVEREFH